MVNGSTLLAGQYNDFDAGVPAAGLSAHPIITGDSLSGTQALLSGTAVAGSTIDIWDGSTMIGTATAGSSGSWSYTATGLSAVELGPLLQPQLILSVTRVPRPLRRAFRFPNSTPGGSSERVSPVICESISSQEIFERNRRRRIRISPNRNHKDLDGDTPSKNTSSFGSLAAANNDSESFLVVCRSAPPLKSKIGFLN